MTRNSPVIKGGCFVCWYKMQGALNVVFLLVENTLPISSVWNSLK